MKANPSPMSVADYCQAYNDKKIIVNDDYQRNVGLWTAQARSFFIESILLEFPIPKLYLHTKLDLKSRQTIKEVVDGQQRTNALVSFYNGTQKLTSNIDTIELRSLKYNQLSPEWQSKFLSYSLPIDQFSGATDDEVREAFRRMNANNIPLNDEEQRNARYQGPFKWFIVTVADKYKGAFSSLGVFSRRDLIRMSDLKLYAELVLTLESGFSTVKGANLDALYKKFNASFPQEEEYTNILSDGIDTLLDQTDLHHPPFMRSHVIQSLILALIVHRHTGRIPANANEDVATIDKAQKTGASIELLATSLKEPDNFPALQDFIDACSKGTNVERSRRVRFIYFWEALRIKYANATVV